MFTEKDLPVFDPEVYSACKNEYERENSHLELIASENIVSRSVMQAHGSVLTNKYAEGYPGQRFYGGCDYADAVEQLAIDRAKKLFGAEHANVQPHAGANANLAVFFALLKPGDTVMGMHLAEGGHLTHGSPANISGKYFNIVSYGVNTETGRLDYDEIERLASQCSPKLIVAGASAYSRFIDYERFSEIARKNGAYLMVDMAHVGGLVAAGVHPSPVPYADVVTTTTHKTLRGPRGGMILCRKELAQHIDKAIFPGTQGGPLMHVIAAKAVCLKEASGDEFKEYGKQIVKNAAVLCKTLQERGARIVSGGTDNHLMLIDLRNTGITGKQLQINLDEVGITANKNTIPGEPLSPFITSGLRIGTPTVTTRGMKENEMVLIGNWIKDIMDDYDANKERVAKEVKALCEKFPIRF